MGHPAPGQALARGLTGLDAYARGELGLGGGGWAAADAGSGLLHLMIDGEEGAQGAVDGLGIGEIGVESGIDDRYVCALGEQVGVLAANAFAEIEVGTFGEWIGFS